MLGQIISPSASIAGLALSLVTAALWAVSPMFMASAGRRVGSFPVVLLRSLLATALLAVAIGAIAAATDARPAFPDARQTGWLVVSGLIGMGVGDVLIYEAFVTLGPRRTTQTLVLAPAVSVVLGWMLQGEALTAVTLVGVGLILAATSYAVLAGRPRPAADAPVAAGEGGDVRADHVPPAPAPRVEPGRVTALGLLCGAGGAVCMAVGAVTGREALRGGPPIDALCATLVRVGSAGALLWIAPIVTGRAGRVLGLLGESHVLKRVGVGTILGPFLGMLCYVAALQQAPAGLVSTLVATSPLFAIPLTVVLYRARIRWDVWVAALVAVTGSTLLFVGK